MHAFIQRTLPNRTLREVVAAVVLGGGLGLFIWMGGQPALILLWAAFVCASLVGLAYFYPLFTAGAWFVLNEVAEELVSIFTRQGGTIDSIVIGPIDVRFGDPILLGIAGATLIAAVQTDGRLRDVLFRQYTFFTLLLGWLFMQVALSVGTHGVVSVLGELRTTFGPLLVLPYVIVFFRTREQQVRLFTLLLVLSLLFIGIGLFAGGTLHSFSFAAYDKWLRSAANMAVVSAALGLYLMRGYGLWNRSTGLWAGLLLAAIGLTVICSHRSVWMGAAFAVGFLILLGPISAAKTVKFAVALLLSAIVIDIAYTNIDLLLFLGDRLKGFTAYGEDSSASWRMQIWSDAWQKTQAHLWMGKGLGDYFSLMDKRGNAVTTSLHNQYLQLIFQIGLIGLMFYIGFVVQAGRRLWRGYRYGRDRFAVFATLLGLTVLVLASAYQIVYGFTEATWLYIGLGMAVALSNPPERERYARPHADNTYVPANYVPAMSRTHPA